MSQKCQNLTLLTCVRPWKTDVLNHEGRRWTMAGQTKREKGTETYWQQIVCCVQRRKYTTYQSAGTIWNPSKKKHAPKPRPGNPTRSILTPMSQGDKRSEKNIPVMSVRSGQGSTRLHVFHKIMTLRHNLVKSFNFMSNWGSCCNLKLRTREESAWSRICGRLTSITNPPSSWDIWHGCLWKGLMTPRHLGWSVSQKLRCPPSYPVGPLWPSGQWSCW